MSFRLGVCSWSLRPQSLADLVESMGRTEIHACQLALVPLVESPALWPDAVAALRDAGIAVLSGMMEMIGEDYTTLETIATTGGVRPDATWSKNRARAEHVATAAQHAGLNLVTFHAGFIPQPGEPERRRMLDRLRTVVDLFATHDIDLALETGQETAATLLELLDELDHPGLGVNFDPANMILYGKGEPVDALRRLAPHVRQIHIKDAVPSPTPGTWGREVPAGTGAVNWPGFFDVVRAFDRPIDLIIEREAGGERIADVLNAAALAKTHLGSAVS
ncbi:MAG: sugar phosphate isomerase/epimerase [Phycisphaerales bacterium]|nr:sugar phosphate isomerase/epimerase [Phycisphaerales bacterium]